MTTPKDYSEPDLRRMAKDARKRRDEAMREGDRPEARRWDAIEREAFRRLPGGGDPVVGSEGRQV